jgi:uncharacterized membrane protein YsdA (DUF1294 family)
MEVSFLNPVAILLPLNLITFVIYGLDKWKAQHNQWRISERTLLSLAVFGGAAGAWAGMQLFRHKTRHKLFSIGVPVLLLVQAVLFARWLA